MFNKVYVVFAMSNARVICIVHKLDQVDADLIILKLSEIYELEREFLTASFWHTGNGHWFNFLSKYYYDVGASANMFSAVSLRWKHIVIEWMEKKELHGRKFKTVDMNR